MMIGVVAFDHGFDSALTTVRDVFRVAEALRPTVDPSIPTLATTTAGFASTARTASGLRVPVEHRLDARGTDGLDLLVVPALDALDPPALETALARRDVRALRGFLRETGADADVGFAAACTGTFVLAEAGLLDDRDATTTWWLTGLFARRYPRVRLDMTRMVVASGSLTTAGATFAHIDLAINLVSRLSPALADAVSRHMLVDERPAQSISAALGHLAETDRLVTAFEEWIRAHLAEPIEISRAAADLAVTRRTLERHVRERLGLSPAEVVRGLRLQRARHLRRTTELSTDAIAQRTGYAGASSLRRALARESGESV
jgi:transcriptional regulator GlxA family with amidase domain